MQLINIIIIIIIIIIINFAFRYASVVTIMIPYLTTVSETQPKGVIKGLCHKVPTNTYCLTFYCVGYTEETYGPVA